MVRLKSWIFFKWNKQNPHKPAQKLKAKKKNIPCSALCNMQLIDIMKRTSGPCTSVLAQNQKKGECIVLVLDSLKLFCIHSMICNNCV